MLCFGKKQSIPGFYRSCTKIKFSVCMSGQRTSVCIRLSVCVKGDVAVSPVVTVTSGQPTCHIAAPPPTLLCERNTQRYYYHWQETCWTTPAIWADSHSVSLCLCLWLISSFLLFGWCSYPSSFLFLSTLVTFCFLNAFFTFVLVSLSVHPVFLSWFVLQRFFCTWH